MSEFEVLRPFSAADDLFLLVYDSENTSRSLFYRNVTRHKSNITIRMRIPASVLQDFVLNSQILHNYAK